MDLSIAVVSWNTRDLLDQCLQSVLHTTEGIQAETIVVDNASTDGSADMVRGAYPQVRLIENAENVGFARANNQAFGASVGRHFVLLNPDTVCLPNALPALVTFLDQHLKAGAVGPLVLNADKTLQYSWARFPTFWSEVRGKLDRRLRPSGAQPMTDDETRANGPFRADWIGGCCLMIKRNAIEQVGLLDESFFMYTEETDWCCRLHKAGWEVWVDPRAEIVHIGGQSSAKSPVETAGYLWGSKVAFFSKHYGRHAGIALGAALKLRFHAKRLLRLRSPE
jgi:N-acetylglucosaminyl-diphospho-decaprenol L-rhamnosyltransferase